MSYSYTAQDYRLTAQRIRELRKAKHLTQRALAEIMGDTAHSISGVETGRLEPSDEQIARFADALDVTADHLRGE